MQPVGLFFSYAVQIGILTGSVQGFYYFLEPLGGVLLFLVLAWFLGSCFALIIWPLDCMIYKILLFILNY